VTSSDQGEGKGGRQEPREFSPTASLTSLPCPEQVKQPSGRQPDHSPEHAESTWRSLGADPPMPPSTRASIGCFGSSTTDYTPPPGVRRAGP
jgi:hypothetical protein